MILRFLRRVVSADVLGLILVLIALRALTSGIAFSLRNTDSKYFVWVGLLAAVIAFGLSKRMTNGIKASMGMIVLGLLGVWILGARLASPLLELGGAVLSLAPQILPAIRSDLPIDAAAVAEAWLVVAEASNTLSARVQIWIMGINGNVTVNDALVRNMAWVLLLWLVASWMGWYAGRRNAVAALLPSILLVAFVTSYSERRVETLWLMVFVLLLLMGLWNYRNHTFQWEQRRVDYSDSIRYDVTQAVVLLSIVLGVLAFITPSISWRELRDVFRDDGRNELAETLGIQQKPVPTQRAPGLQPTLPREHLLSGGFAQSEEVVMTIRTGEPPPIFNPMLNSNAPRYYWRSATYDSYVGAGWVTSSARGQRYEANTPLIPGLLSGYRSLSLVVEMAQPEGKLFWSGILFSADVPLRADWRLRPQSNLFADQSTLLQADLFAAVSDANTYRAEAYLPLVTIEELRGASLEYPESITDRYLQLPRSVPERVHQLARQITEGEATAYDKAKAIEAYLRTYPYDLEVPAPPEGEDVADYFLFELQKGYCDYYATSMVVLARASGLPARFVSGYASGSYDAANAEYVVRELHAHSWAEIYFPQIGWVEFEPTGAQPQIEIPLREQEIVHTPPGNEAASQLLNRFRVETLLYWLAPAAILFLGCLLYFAFLERWLYMRLPPGSAVERIYRRLYRLGRPLAGERTRAETAREFMSRLIDRLDTIRGSSRSSGYLSHAADDLRSLTHLYQDALFAQHTIDGDDVRQALNAWKRLRWRLLLARGNLRLRRSVSSIRSMLTPRARGPFLLPARGPRRRIPAWKDGARNNRSPQ